MTMQVRMKSYLARAAVLLGLVAWSFSANANTLTPKKGSAKILAEPTKGAKVLGEVKQGESIEAIERKGMFWKVKTKGGDGFVSFLDVKRQAGGASSSLAKAIRGAAQDTRGADENSGVRARSAVMGVRGLDESDEVAGAGTVSPNLRMVYAMEDLKISPDGISSIEERVFAEIEQRADQL